MPSLRQEQACGVKGEWLLPWTRTSGLGRFAGDASHCHRPWGPGGDVRPVRLVLGLAAG